MKIQLYSPRSKLFNEIIFKSWWVILFFLLCLFAYDRAMRVREKEELALRKKLKEVKMELVEVQEKQEDLKLQISSQEDPQWIQLTLMRELGVVPEGQQKVLFVPPS